MDLIPKLVDYIIYVRQLQIKNNYKPSTIFAADETAVWFDMLSETTVETVGAKQVPIRTTGHEKMRVTVLLTARADGKKTETIYCF